MPKRDPLAAADEWLRSTFELVAGGDKQVVQSPSFRELSALRFRWYRLKRAWLNQRLGDLTPEANNLRSSFAQIVPIAADGAMYALIIGQMQALAEANQQYSSKFWEDSFNALGLKETVVRQALNFPAKSGRDEPK